MGGRFAAVGGLLLFACAVAAGDDDADRGRLIGKWQPAGREGAELWLLETVGDSLRISHSLGQKTDQIQCNIMGKDCEATVGGRKTKVSLWFNGAMLVEMETRGTDVTKRRFRVTDEDRLKLEVIPIVPAGKTEVAEYKRTK